MLRSVVQVHPSPPGTRTGCSERCGPFFLARASLEGRFHSGRSGPSPNGSTQRVFTTNADLFSPPDDCAVTESEARGRATHCAHRPMQVSFCLHCDCSLTRGGFSRRVASAARMNFHSPKKTALSTIGKRSRRESGQALAGRATYRPTPAKAPSPSTGRQITPIHGNRTGNPPHQGC